LPLAAALTLSAALYTACGDDDDDGSPGTGGAVGTDAGAAGAGLNGQAGTESSGGGVEGVAGAGGVGASTGGAIPSDGGSSQGPGGAPQNTGGEIQSAGGRSQSSGGAASEGGATQSNGGAPQSDGGVASVAGAGGAGSCEGELIAGECVVLPPVVRVQTAKRTAGTGVASDVVKFAADTQAGNFLMLSVGVVWTGTVQTITVPTGFTLVEQRNNTVGTSQHETAALYIAQSAPVLPAATGVTVSLGGAADARLYLILAEYAGLQSSGALDQKASSSGTSDPTPGTTPTTTADHELWVVVNLSRGGVAHTNPTEGFAFVETSMSGAGSFSVLQRIVTERGAATANVSGSGDFASIIATFRRRL